MTTYLGIDYGLAHLGLAYAESTLATPLPSIRNDATTISHLTSLISQLSITHIVLGLPTGPVAPHVLSFAELLESTYHLPVALHDETLSSHEAKEKLIQAGASRKKRRDEHSYSAVLILEGYLETVLN